MNKQTEALKMAVEALESFEKVYGDTDLLMPHNFYKSLQACKEALEQPAQEPFDVARVQEDGYVEWREGYEDLPVGTKLYTHPAPSWQSITNDEIKSLCDVVIEIESNDVIEYEWHEMEKIARAIEQALKEKNKC